MFGKIMKLLRSIGVTKCLVCGKWSRHRFCSDRCTIIYWETDEEAFFQWNSYQEECSLCGGLHPTSYCLNQETGYEQFPEEYDVPRD